MDKIKKKVEDKISGKKVMVFSKSSCGYCAMAKECFRKLLTSRELKREDYEVWEIGGEPDCNAIQTYLHRRTGAKTVPRVFINGVSVGGASDVQKLERQKKLMKTIYPDEELSVAISTKEEQEHSSHVSKTRDYKGDSRMTNTSNIVRKK